MVARRKLAGEHGTLGPQLVDRLDAEWQQLVASRAAARALAQWGNLEPALAHWPDLAALRAAVHDRTNLEHGDNILAALTRLAAVDGGGDQLAARVVLQLLVPGAKRLAHNLVGMFGDLPTADAMVFSELTIGIRTYPWQRRPARVAANLLLDCRQRLVRTHHRTHRETTVGLQLHAPEPGDDHEGEFALTDLLRWARRNGVLDQFETQLLVASHVAAMPMDKLTTVFGRSRSTLYAARAGAEQRLRQALETPLG